MKYVCQADIVEKARELEANNVFTSRENELARFCLACLSVGAKKRNVRMLSEPIRKENFEKYWANLEKAGYFLPNKHIAIEELDTVVPFVLMMFCADGRIERKWQKEGETS